MLATNPKNIVVSTKDLSVLDYSLMSFMSYELKKRLSAYFKIDSFTMPDPFPIKDGFNYFIVVDKSNTNRVISLVAIKSDMDIVPWDSVLGRDMLRVDSPPEDILSLKEDLLPKDNDNFYPIRKDSSVVGSIAFAFEICGKKDDASG
jgi:hypothetical protein